MTAAVSRLQALPPGDYRVFAVPSTLRGKLDEPSVLERVVAGARTISLALRGLHNVALKLVEP